jgi:tetratricopeptide (TPR) repeat protein
VAGETIASAVEMGTEADLFDLVSRAGLLLRQRLGVASPSSGEGRDLARSLPSNPEALRLYSEGLDRLRTLDALRARDLLQDAIAADPQFALAHAALGSAWAALGYDAKAGEEAKKAFELSAGLPREDRLWIEARHLAALPDWGRAAKAYQQLVALVPDNLEYSLKLAEAQNWAGRPQEALATIDALRKLPAPAGIDPRIDLAESLAASYAGDFKRVRAAAVRAAEQATRQRARFLVARARMSEGYALANLGQTSEADAAWQEASRLYRDAGDLAGVARAMSRLGQIRWTAGSLDEAEQMYHASLAICRQIGDRGGEADALFGLANLQRRQGKISQAKRLFEEVLAADRERGAKLRAALTLNLIAALVHQQGDLAGAERMYEEALAIAREAGDKKLVALGLQFTAGIAHDRGNLPGAQSRYEQAIAINQEIGQQTTRAEGLYRMAALLRSRGDLAEARKKAEEAVAILGRIGARLFVPQARLSLAWQSFEEGDPVEAERVARQAAQESEKSNTLDVQASAQAALARALQAQGRVKEAQKEADRAAALAAKSEFLHLRLSIAVIVARVRAGAGGPSAAARAIKSVETVHAEARRIGFVPLQFEARLALGEMELLAGRSTAGRQHLEELAKDARALGFGLVARKAATAAGGTS